MTDIRALITKFERFSRHKDYSTSFTEILDILLIPFCIYETLEERERQLTTFQERTDKAELTELFTTIGDLSENFNDPLGQLFMDKVSNDKQGQFFTPGHVCDFIAQITLGNPENGKTILDPACGSGRFLLSAAKINRHVLLFGADIDALCCKMAVINMLLQSLTGEIAHMDSLSNQFYSGYHIDAPLYNGHYYPRYKHFTNPEESLIWMHPVAKDEPMHQETTVVFPKGRYSQGSLF